MQPSLMRRFVTPAAIVVLLASAFAGAAYAVGSSSKTVTFCVNPKSRAVTIADRCGKRQKAYTVDKAGPTGATGAIGPQGAMGTPGAVGAQGPQGNAGAQGPTGDTGSQGVKGDTGPSGVLNALYDSNGNGVGLSHGTTSGRVVSPASAVAATLKNIPAGTYLMNGAVSLTAPDDISGDISCSLVSTQTSGTPTNDDGTWSGLLAENTSISVSLVGRVNFTATGTVALTCYNYNGSGDAALLDFGNIALTQVQTLTATTG